jgi:hypothetical protein
MPDKNSFGFLASLCSFAEEADESEDFLSFFFCFSVGSEVVDPAGDENGDVVSEKNGFFSLVGVAAPPSTDVLRSFLSDFSCLSWDFEDDPRLLDGSEDSCLSDLEDDLSFSDLPFSLSDFDLLWWELLPDFDLDFSDLSFSDLSLLPRRFL